jgi:hypothetical protein
MTEFRHSIARRRRNAGFAVAVVALISGALVAAPAWAQTAPATTDTLLGDDSNSTDGIGQINQNAGDDNNQANVTVIALTTSDNSATLAHVIGSSRVLGPKLSNVQSLQNNTIADSFNGFTGIAQVNQTTGGANVELNVIALAFAAGAQFSSGALTDIELDAVTAPTDPDAPGSALPGSANTVSNSFNDFTGIGQVAQVVGDRNMVTNVVAVAFATAP